MSLENYSILLTFSKFVRYCPFSVEVNIVLFNYQIQNLSIKLLMHNIFSCEDMHGLLCDYCGMECLHPDDVKQQKG